MKKVIVASKNPVKITSTKLGFEQMLPDDEFEVEGITVQSGVSDQPMTDQETYKGALNRARNARKAHPDADYWVGIEGGIEVHEGRMSVLAWILILSLDQQGGSKTATFDLPEKFIELIKSGMELGQASDLIFDDTNSKQKNGAVGLLTDNIIDRTNYYREAIVLALIPFKNKKYY